MVGNRKRVLLSLMQLTVLLSLGGCGGRAEDALGATQAAGGAASIAASGASASGVSGAALPTGGAPGSVAGASSSSAGTAPVDAGVLTAPDAGSLVVGARPTCGGPGVDTDNSCLALAQLEFENPSVKWADGGVGVVVVTITNAGASVVPYPCFGLTVDQPTTSLPTTLEPDLYALQAGESGPHTFPVQFAGPVPPGTVLHFTIWVDSLNVTCAGVGEFSFTVSAI